MYIFPLCGCVRARIRTERKNKKQNGVAVRRDARTQFKVIVSFSHSFSLLLLFFLFTLLFNAIIITARSAGAIVARAYIHRSYNYN